jgi:branched-chain amino acid transport system substrate-binding protein
MRWVRLLRWAKPVLAVAEWHPNVGGAASEAFYGAFVRRFPDPHDDYVHVRMAVLVEMLAAAIERAGSTEAAAVAHTLEGARFDGRMAGMAGLTLHPAVMRAADHQLQQPLVVSVMERAGTPGVPHQVEGSGYGFRTVRSYDAAALAQTPRCRMARPE